MIIKNTTDKLLDIAWPREDGTYNLSGADLSGAYLIDAGQDNRGYRFVARQGEPMMISAGCRWLTAAGAREHWANNLECLGKVEMIVAEATRRGWTI